MASRLIPLLAALTIAAAGCGGSHAESGEARADTPTGAGASAANTDSTARSTARATSRTAPVRNPFVTSVRKPAARLWAVGDSAGGDEATAVADLVKRGKPDRFVYLGDVYPDGSAFDAYARVYGSLWSITAPTPGNHDWGPGYRRYWGGHPPEWYSFSAAGWRIISLNSETSRHGAQLDYLHALLRGRGNCRIAFWHRPRWSGGLHGDNADMDPYWRALAGHARIVLGGHDHDMQRFAPRDGLTEFVSGAGGKSHYPVRAHPGLRFDDWRHLGALRLDLRRGSARAAFVATDGRVLDSKTVTCSP